MTFERNAESTRREIAFRRNALRRAEGEGNLTAAQLHDTRLRVLVFHLRDLAERGMA